MDRISRYAPAGTVMLASLLVDAHVSRITANVLSRFLMRS